MQNITVIANAATDLLHSKDTIQEISDKSNGRISVKAFLNALPELLGKDDKNKPILPEAPRRGDAIHIPNETLHIHAREFLTQQNLPLSENFNHAERSPIEQFAGPHEKAPGGALANTSATIAHSGLTNMGFLSVSDENEEKRKNFAAGFPAGVVKERLIKGSTLEVYVFPIDGDRIQIAAPSLNNSTDRYDLSPHIPDTINVDTDIVMIEGFLAFGDHYDKITEATLNAIKSANIQRDALGRAPIHLVITAASQPISDMESHRNFVKRAIETTDVTIHANTGEFRRIVGQDKEWRQPFEADFLDENGDTLIGSKLETAKKNHTAYQNAKTQANMDVAKNTAVPMAANAPHNVRFIVTDGGNQSHVIQNDKHRTYVPDQIDPDNIVNKVGAGDAFMAGYWIAQLEGLDIENSMKIGGVFARECLYQDAARLSPGQIADLMEKYITPLKSKNSEIERKFLVENDDWKSLPNIGESAILTQGYIPQGWKNDTYLYIDFPDDETSIAQISIENDKERYSFAGIKEIEGKTFQDITKAGIYNATSHEITLQGRTEARVRIKDSATDPKAVFAVKIYEDGGRQNREEFEIEMTIRAAQDVLNIFAENIISKERTKVPYKGKILEFDEYLQGNKGFTTVDIEFRNANERDLLQKPSGVGQDITDEENLRNQNLAANGVPEEYKIKMPS